MVDEAAIEDITADSVSADNADEVVKADAHADDTAADNSVV